MARLSPDVSQFPRLLPSLIRDIMHCPICANSSFKVEETKALVKYLRCEECGHVR